MDSSREGWKGEREMETPSAEIGPSCDPRDDVPWSRIRIITEGRETDAKKEAEEDSTRNP